MCLIEIEHWARGREWASCSQKARGEEGIFGPAAPGVRNLCCGDFQGSQNLCVPFSCDCLENNHRVARRCQPVLSGIDTDKQLSLVSSPRIKRGDRQTSTGHCVGS